MHLAISRFRKVERAFMRGKVSSLVVLIVMCVMAGSTLDSHAEPGPPREYLIKAAFLYNFAKFVEWPAEALPDIGISITFGIVGDNPFGGALESMEGKTVKGRKVVIRQFKGVQDLKFVHILFVSSSEKKRLPKIMKTIKDWNVLTVGDTEGFTEVGGIINLIIVRNKVRFEINAVNAQQARLKISSKLLKLARDVRR